MYLLNIFETCPLKYVFETFQMCHSIPATSKCVEACLTVSQSVQ